LDEIFLSQTALEVGLVGIALAQSWPAEIHPLDKVFLRDPVFKIYKTKQWIKKFTGITR
jgi:hypothetical protein